MYDNSQMHRILWKWIAPADLDLRVTGFWMAGSFFQKGKHGLAHLGHAGDQFGLSGVWILGWEGSWMSRRNEFMRSYCCRGASESLPSALHRLKWDFHNVVAVWKTTTMCQADSGSFVQRRDQNAAVIPQSLTLVILVPTWVAVLKVLTSNWTYLGLEKEQQQQERQERGQVTLQTWDDLVHCP